jgi:hypothetical protein
MKRSIRRHPEVATDIVDSSRLGRTRASVLVKENYSPRRAIARERSEIISA